MHIKDFTDRAAKPRHAAVGGAGVRPPLLRIARSP